MTDFALLARRLTRSSVAACAWAIVLSQLAVAAELSRNGATIRLAGPIVDGDQVKFKDMLTGAGGQSVQIVNLNSGGGKIEPAGDIARLIRARGLATLLDGMHAKCASACTVIFAGGVRRYYVNAERLADGPTSNSGFVGLGFHQGGSSLSLEGNRYSGRASAQMIAFYYEFGIPRAADLVTKAPPQRLYRISGPTALALGIATSLQGP